jgi:hypothetical protein
MTIAKLIVRLRAIQKVAAFTTTDMARWFGVKRPTITHWLTGHARPYAAVASQLEEPLFLLEKACTHRKFAKKLPVPLSIGVLERNGYIEELKAYAVKSFSKTGSAGRGSKMLGGAAIE